MTSEIPPFRSEREQQTVYLSKRDAEDAARLLRLLTGSGEAERVKAVATSPSTQPARRSLLELAEAEVARRKRRKEFFSPAMFGEAPWDILLILYTWEAKRSPPTVGELSIASETPVTTSLRWLDHLEGQGFVRRESHPTDRRSNLILLTSTAREALDLYLFETLTHAP